MRSYFILSNFNFMNVDIWDSNKHNCQLILKTKKYWSSMTIAIIRLILTHTSSLIIGYILLFAAQTMKWNTNCMLCNMYKTLTTFKWCLTPFVFSSFTWNHLWKTKQTVEDVQFKKNIKKILNDTTPIGHAIKCVYFASETRWELSVIYKARDMYLIKQGLDILDSLFFFI